MKIEGVVEEIQDWFISRFLSRAFEKRMVLMGLSHKKRIKLSKAALGEIKGEIRDQLETMHQKGRIPEELRSQDLANKLIQILSSYVASTTDDDVMKVLDAYKNEQRRQNNIDGLIQHYHRYQVQAKKILKDAKDANASEAKWDLIIKQCEKEKSSIEWIKRNIGDTLEIVVLIILVAYLSSNSSLVREYESSKEFRKHIATTSAMMDLLLVAMGLSYFLGRVVLPRLQPRLNQAESQMRATIETMIHAEYESGKLLLLSNQTMTQQTQKPMTSFSRHTFFAESNPENSSVSSNEMSSPSTSENAQSHQPKIKVKTRRPGKAEKEKENDNVVNDESTPRIKPVLIKMKNTDNLYLNWDEERVKAMLASDEQDLLPKFRDAAFSGRLLSYRSKGKTGLKECLFFHKVRNEITRENEYESCPRKIKIHDGARLYFTLNEVDGKRVYEVAEVETNAKKTHRYGRS